MQGTCPNCQALLELPGPGLYECERCKARFEVPADSQGQPSQVPAPPPLPSAPVAPDPLPGVGSSPGLEPIPGWPASPAGPTAWPPQTAAPGAALPGAYTPGLPPAAFGPPPFGPALDPSLQAPCANHPTNAATSVCERCGDFICRLCSTAVEGRLYCPKCFDLMYSRGSLQFAQRQFTLPGITLGLGIGATLLSFVCCVPVSVPLGIGGLVVGVRALREYRDRPELPDKALTHWGLSLSALSFVVPIALVIYWISLVLK